MFLHSPAAARLHTAPAPSMTLLMDDQEHQAKDPKPSLEEITEYADKMLDVYLGKHAAHLPREQKDEIKQRGFLRLIEAYDRIDAEKGWKAFVQRHCRGTVLDYIRLGAGFEESSLGPSAEERESDEGELDETYAPQRLRTRVIGRDDEKDQTLDVEQVAAVHGIFTDFEPKEKLKLRWRLIARMAAVDQDIHLIAKMLLGFRLTELAAPFQVSREMLHQRLNAFVERLDDPEFYHDPWVQQTIYAFGLSEHFGMEPRDMGVGWQYEPVDLFDGNSVALMHWVHQMDLGFETAPAQTHENAPRRIRATDAQAPGENEATGESDAQGSLFSAASDEKEPSDGG